MSRKPHSPQVVRQGGRNPERRGMLLLELMGVLILIAAFSLISAELFDSLLHVTDEARGAGREDRRRRELLARMRADVWNAIELGVVGEREVVLRLSGERSVFWKLHADAPLLSRVEMVETRETSEERWEAKDGSLPARFRLLKPGVRVEWPDAKAADGGVVDLYSQLVSLTGGGG